MKTFYYLPLLLISALTMNAQSKWSPYGSIEENIHFTDVSASLNYLDLSVPAANSGMRLGAFYTHNNLLSSEVTLGITGVGTPGSFSSKIVPLEFIGHLNLIGGMNVPVGSKFNLDAGVGSGLIESSNGRFSFSEHVVLGASAELPSVLPFGTMIIGTRYTLFVDDYIDGTIVSGSSNDAVLRFFTAIRFDGRSKMDTKDIEGVNKLLLENIQLQKTLKEKEIEIVLYQNVIKDQTKYDQEVITNEEEPIDHEEVVSALEKVPVQLNQNKATEYAIIIASFSNLESANAFVNEQKSKCKILIDDQSGNFRIAYKIVDSLEEANKLSTILRDQNKDYWILKL